MRSDSAVAGPVGLGAPQRWSFSLLFMPWTATGLGLPSWAPVGQFLSPVQGPPGPGSHLSSRPTEGPGPGSSWTALCTTGREGRCLETIPLCPIMATEGCSQRGLQGLVSEQILF